ncbi:MAG: 50S ribosomal protein L14e [Candidatus Kariarchaeaceae archaeon]
MNAISVGRIVVKIMGREAGKKAVVTQIIDRNFVEITGPEELTGVRRRRVNINHIEPTEHKVDISRGSDDAAVKSAVESESAVSSFMTS